MRMELRRGSELDEYTERLIRQAEEEGLISAPVHMKQEILKRSQSLDYQISVQARQISKRMQFLLYSMKVGAAVAMALFLLFMVPTELPDMRMDAGSGTESMEIREESLGDKLGRGFRTFDRILTDLRWSVYYDKQMED